MAAPSHDFWDTPLIEPSDLNFVDDPETSTESQRAAVVAPLTSLKPKKRPRKLDNEKCAQCRHDKVKCSPQPRCWPQKCERCTTKGFECSPGEVKRRVRRKMSPFPPLPSDSESPRRGDQARGETDKEPIEPDVAKAQSSWGCTELSNLVIFAQLLDDEYNFLHDAVSLYADLGLFPDVYENLDFVAISKLCEIGSLYQWQKRDIAKAIHDRQQSESLSPADQILCENAYEALSEDFVVPSKAPISNESLVKLPVGMQIRHLIRTLRLDIEQCGSGDFEPLLRLADQLWDEWPALQALFGITDTTDMPRVDIPGRYNPTGPAAIRLVVAQTSLSDPFLCMWVRDMIELSLGTDVPFPIRILSEIWSGDRDPADLSSITPPIDVDARDSEGHSLLHVAVLCDKPRIVRELVDRNPPPNYQLTSGGHNPFHDAVGVGSVDCYSELLRLKDAMKMERMPGAHEELPLHIAARNGRKEMVDCILSAHSDDGDYVNAENAWCQTPLMLAVRSGDVNIVQSFLDFPGIDLTVEDEDGETALSLSQDNTEMFRLILSSSPKTASIRPMKLARRHYGSTVHEKNMSLVRS